MCCAVADGVVEDIQEDLANDEKEDAKDDVSQRPAVLQRVDDQHKLQHDVDEKDNGVEEINDDKQADRFVGSQATPALECQERDGAGDDEHAEGAQAQQPDRQGRAVLVQLEADETVDQQADAQCRRQAVLGSSEVREWAAAGRHNAGVEEQRKDGQEQENVEEGGDFLAAYIGSR